jgi:hypothetical protein
MMWTPVVFSPRTRYRISRLTPYFGTESSVTKMVATGMGGGAVGGTEASEAESEAGGLGAAAGTGGSGVAGETGEASEAGEAGEAVGDPAPFRAVGIDITDDLGPVRRTAPPTPKTERV